MVMIDMPFPRNCAECTLNDYVYCYVTGDDIRQFFDYRIKPCKCPVKPVEEKKHES